MSASPAERAVIALGIVPLAAAAVWLVVLREPQPVEAFARQRSVERLVDERTASPEPRFVGVVVAGQDAELAAELVGEVVHVFAEPGTRVRRGDPLVQLAALSVVGARGMAAAQAAEDRFAIEAARLGLETARDNADRMASAENAYATRDVLKARADEKRAAAELERLRGSVAVRRATLHRELARADKQLVRAPFDGVLAARFVDVGDFVGAGQALARVVDFSRFVRFAVPASEHAQLQPGLWVRAFAPAPFAPLTAAIVDVDPELDPAAGLGFARAKLPADSAQSLRLAPGTRIDVALLTANQVARP
jgi:multidrug efflux pump subunit AcrA (membrane-fusion protein)